MSDPVPADTTPADPVPGDPAGAEPGAPPAAWRWPIRLAVVVPIAVAVVRALARGWFPIGDDALLTLRAADVFTRNHPLLGSWTSASLALGTDVNNPGPLYDDLLAPFMWTFGRVFGFDVGVAVGVGAVNAAAALGTLVVAARLGGWRAERWAILLVAALAWSMGSELLFDIWQPHALLLPFTLLVMLTVGLVSGDRALLPWWLAVVSLIVQTHIGYAYVAAALAVLVLVALGRGIGGGRARWASALTGRTARVSAIVVVVAWAQPLWEQLFGAGEGNLARLARSAGGGDVTIGARNAVRLVGAVLVVPGWTRFGFADAIPPTSPLVDSPDGPSFTLVGPPGFGVSALGLAVLVGVLVALWRALRGPDRRVVRAAVTVALAMVLVAVVSLAGQVVGLTGLGSHQVRWIFAMAAFVHVTIVWGAVEWRGGRLPRAPLGDYVLLALAGALTAANLGFQAHALGPVGDRRVAPTLEAVFADLARFDPDGPVVYDVSTLLVFEPYSSSVIMRLEEQGTPVRLEHEGYLRQYGPGRRADGTEPVRLLQYERDAALRYAGTGCIVSRHSAVGAAEERRVDAIVDAAAADLAGAAIDAAGLPPDVAALAAGAAEGDTDAAYRLVMRALLPVLVDEQRVAPTPAIDAAVTDAAAITARVNSTLAIVAEPASAC